MKLLLTSGGVSSPPVLEALRALVGRPLDQASALCVPTAEWGHPMCTPETAWRFVSGTSPAPMVDLGWRSVGLLELAGLPAVGRDRWEPWVRAADVLLVDGGDALYLAHWLHASGLADLLPELDDTVWVGCSAGSMALTPWIGEEFTQWHPPADDPGLLGLVDFSLFPHLAIGDGWGNSEEEAQAWLARRPGPAYVLDDRCAVSVVDGVATPVGDGVCRYVPAPA